MAQDIGSLIKNKILLVALFVGLAGCTEQVSQFQLTRPVSSLNSYQHAIVSIHGEDLDITTQYGFRETAEVMHKKIVSAIRPTGLFNTINGDHDGSSQLEVAILITEFRYVSGPKRSLAWFFANDAILVGLIQLKDKDSGKIVGEMSFIEKSGDQKAMLSDYTGKQINKVTNLTLALLTTI